jgi:proteasome accessory factor C
MVKGATAADQLSRILHLLPLATREQGVSLDRLAAEVGLEREQVVEDLHVVATRADYHRAGPGDDTQIVVEADRVYVWTTGEFRRPARFSPAESLALGMGLRVLAAEQGEEQGTRVLALAERLESTLAGVERERWEEHLALDAGQGSGTTRAALLEAARTRRCCELLYLKTGAERPEHREVEPYVAVVAAGVWYVLARCQRSDGVRAFRLDRIIGVAPGEERFEVPADFDPEQYLRGGRVFHAAEEAEVVVRYSPRIARWIVEKGPAEACADGSVVVRHRVADPRWLVRHVLQYGSDAEVLEPAEFRERVRAAVGRVRGAAAAL